MYARKANCGFMRTYRPCYIGSEEKVLYCFAYLCFSTAGRQVLPHIIKEVDIRKSFTASSLFTIDRPILNQEKN